MIPRKKKITRKKVSKKKGSVFAGIVRFGALLFVLLVLFFSVGTVGYVIFFRTVYAQQTLPSIKSVIVFEVPNSPVHVDPVEEVKSAMEPDLPKVAIILCDKGYHGSIGKESLAVPVELTSSFLPSSPTV